MSAAPGRQLHPLLLRPDPAPGTRPASEIGAALDDAIAAFRLALPGCGMKLVVPPPLPDGSALRLYVSAWRRGDPSTRVHAAITAREGMRLLLDNETETGCEARRRGACPLCHGAGWYIAKGGVRTICTHPGVEN